MNGEQREKLSEIQTHIAETIPPDDTLRYLHENWLMGGGDDHSELEYVKQALIYVIGVLLSEQRIN